MGSANISVYRGVRVTRQPLTTTTTDGCATTTYTFEAHPRKTVVSADSLDAIHKKMDEVLDAKP